jgi:hypothetical protein
MDKPQSVDRAIYIPKGRRLLLEANANAGVDVPSVSKKRYPRDESLMEDETHRAKSNSRPSSSEHQDTDKKEQKNNDLKDTVSTKPRTVSSTGEKGIYIPRGRRELNEQKDAAAQTSKPEPIRTAPQTVFEPRITAKPSSSPQVPVEVKVAHISAEAPPPAVESIPLSTLALDTAKKEPSRAVGLYVPKGRRELNEKMAVEAPAAVDAAKAKSTASSSRTAGTGSVAGEDGEVPAVASKPALAPYTKWDDDSEEDEEPAETPYIPPPSQDEIIGDSCLVLSGIPAEMTEMARSNIVRPYQDKGASVRWVSGQECLIAFKSDRVATGAIPPMGASIFRVVRVRDAPLSARAGYIEGTH